jgi:hypothetical protein
VREGPDAPKHRRGLGRSDGHERSRGATAKTSAASPLFFRSKRPRRAAREPPQKRAALSSVPGRGGRAERPRSPPQETGSALLRSRARRPRGTAKEPATRNGQRSPPFPGEAAARNGQGARHKKRAALSSVPGRGGRAERPRNPPQETGSTPLALCIGGRSTASRRAGARVAPPVRRAEGKRHGIRTPRVSPGRQTNMNEPRGYSLRDTFNRGPAGQATRLFPGIPSSPWERESPRPGSAENSDDRRLPDLLGLPVTPCPRGAPLQANSDRTTPIGTGKGQRGRRAHAARPRGGPVPVLRSARTWRAGFSGSSPAAPGNVALATRSVCRPLSSSRALS